MGNEVHTVIKPDGTFFIPGNYELIGHNIICYDIPLMQKLLYQCKDVNFGDCVDTLVMSRVLNPDRLGGHSLEAWMERFGGEKKVKQEQWLEFDENMIARCQSDVLATERVYLELLKEIRTNGVLPDEHK